MKLMHMADLHIGKRVNEFNMLEDQSYILQRILEIAVDEKPDAILIAGDVYDKSQPSAEAVELLDEFLTALTVLKQPIFMISGNHDSPERLGFGSRMLKKNSLHIAGVFNGYLQKEILEDEHGIMNIYLLPFVKPAMARPYFEQEIESYEQAVGVIIASAGIDRQERNILLAHQFVTGGAKQPERSDSESISMGGLDNVGAEVFEPFDYVALGHLHGPQRIWRDTIRYAGSPLKYSFSEAGQRKTLTILELGKKGNVNMKFLPLTPLHDLREIKGPIAELLRIGRLEPGSAEDYIHATLTDEEDIYDAIGQLRQVYPNMMAMDFENSRSGQSVSSKNFPSCDAAQKNPMELFEEFYQTQNNNELSGEQIRIMEGIFEKSGGGGL